jgi:hypothetical protein
MAGLAGGRLRFAGNRLTTGSVVRFGREPSAAKIGEVANLCFAKTGAALLPMTTTTSHGLVVPMAAAAGTAGVRKAGAFGRT